MTTLSSAVPSMKPKQHNFVKDFIELRRKVAAEGLMRRRYLYYWAAFIGIAAIYVGLGVDFVLLGDSWWQLLIASLLANTLMQFVYLGDDAAHLQILICVTRHEWARLTLHNLLVGVRCGL